MARFKVGVQLHPQATSVASLLDAGAAFDAAGVDSLWVWDHFYPLYGDPDAAHFEAYTLMAALAARTERATIGALVTCNSYRNPSLLADMSRTIDHISDGRFVLGIGSGWFERDYEEYGYEFGTAIGRLRQLERDLPIIKDRLAKLNPPPVGDLPILIGGSGRKVTLKLVAEHADSWNAFGPPEQWAELNGVLDDHCATVGRDPGEIERTVAINVGELDKVDEYVAVGVDHIILMHGDPFGIGPVEQLIAAAQP